MDWPAFTVCCEFFKECTLLSCVISTSSISSSLKRLWTHLNFNTSHSWPFLHQNACSLAKATINTCMVSASWTHTGTTGDSQAATFFNFCQSSKNSRPSSNTSWEAPWAMGNPKRFPTRRYEVANTQKVWAKRLLLCPSLCGTTIGCMLVMILGESNSLRLLSLSSSRIIKRDKIFIYIYIIYILFIVDFSSWRKHILEDPSSAFWQISSIHATRKI